MGRFERVIRSILYYRITKIHINSNCHIQLRVLNSMHGEQETYIIHMLLSSIRKTICTEASNILSHIIPFQKFQEREKVAVSVSQRARFLQPLSRLTKYKQANESQYHNSVIISLLRITQ